jgi:predicted esterase
MSASPASQPDPHADGILLHAGTPLEQANCALILLHGRHGSAEDILALGNAIAPPAPGRNLALLAPEAANRTWYPNSFLAARASNEPFLASALRRVESLVQTVAAAGIPPQRIVLCGFSQGACLATEFVATHPAPYAGLIAFTGGLIGPPGTPFAFTGDLAHMPALLLTGDPDPHVPYSRVEESAATLTRLGAQVTLHRYPNRPHTVSREEIALAQQLIENVFSPPPQSVP